MPIALLLFESTLDFAFGGHQMSPWVHLVEMEEKLIDRARSAFLVKWFGTGLPLRGFYLKVAIENLEALRNRYLEAKASVEPELSGPNLMDPLAGTVGQLGGMLFSPTGVILLAAVSVRKLKTWVGILLEVLAGLVSPIITGLGLGIVVGVGLPLFFIAGLYLGATKQEETGAIVALLGALAQLLNSTSLFIDQLLGPRDKVANPVLRQMLELFDHLAGLGVQVLGFVAVVVTEIGPLLFPLALQVGPFSALISSVLDTLSFIWDDMLDQFGKLMDPKYTVLRTIDIVVDVLSALFPMLIDRFTAFFTAASDAFKGLFKDLKGASSQPAKPGVAAKAGSGFLGFFETVGKWLDDAVNKSPLIVNMKAGKELFTLAGDALSSKSSSSSPSTFPTLPPMKLTSAEDMKSALGGEPILGLDSIGPLGSLMDTATRWMQGGPLPLSEAAAKQVERARNPASVFAAEKHDLFLQLGKRTPEKALADQLASQQQLRSLIAGVMGRILPPGSRTSMADSFAAIDAKIYGKSDDEDKKDPKHKHRDLPKKDFPVRDLPDNHMLRPVVRRLTVRSSTAEKLDLEDFADRVRKALLAQTYPAPVTA